MLRSMEVRTIVISLLTSLAGWGAHEIVAGSSERATTAAALAAHDHELARQRDAIERISLVLERQTTLAETYGETLRDLAAELHERNAAEPATARKAVR